MTEFFEFVVRHGYAFIFVFVIAEQIGLPVPAIPILLSAGALAGLGDLALGPAIFIGFAAAVIGDLGWYALGRARGRSVLNMVCRVSLEPDSCVRRTQNAFQRYGSRLLLFAKFIPGLSTAAPPLAAISPMPFVTFLFWDAAGALAWIGGYMGLGYAFREQLEEVARYAGRLGGGLLILMVGLLAFYLTAKYLERMKFLQMTDAARISCQELMKCIEAGEQVFVADLRHPIDLQLAPVKIPGAVQMTPQELSENSGKLPRDRDIVLYCSCPNDATSAHMSLALRRTGITRIRPLGGGLEAWQKLGYPVEPLRPAA